MARHDKPAKGKAAGTTKNAENAASAIKKPQADATVKGGKKSALDKAQDPAKTGKAAVIPEKATARAAATKDAKTAKVASAFKSSACGASSACSAKTSAKGAMWGGRFSGGPAELVREFLESVSFDQALYAQDIAGSKAHAAMLAAQGVISEKESRELIRGLDAVLEEIESGRFVWKRDLEDVHMNIESRLTEIVGDVGKKLHTGRSRNDQVALDFRLFVRDAAQAWRQELLDLIEALTGLAKKHGDTLLPGFTHLQPAQPVSLAHHLLAYAFMFKRDAERLFDADKRIAISPLGAAALAGTTYPLDPASVAKNLGLHGTFDNSMDAVSDRDFALEAMFCASLIMTHLSRLCEDIIIWANPAFGYVRLSDGYSTGSSIMPQKKNPDVAEVIRGKTGRVYGSLMSLLTTMKGLPMTYNRDQQEDKEPFFNTHRTVSMSLAAMSGMLSEIEFLPENMARALKRGFLNATELADYLVGKGIPFREAHHYTGSVVALAEKQGVALEELPLKAFKGVCEKISDDVYAILSPLAAVSRREAPGGTGPKSVKRQIATLEKWMKGLK